jgi:hypothetical protein
VEKLSRADWSDGSGATIDMQMSQSQKKAGEMYHKNFDSTNLDW